MNGDNNRLAEARKKALGALIKEQGRLNLSAVQIKQKIVVIIQDKGQEYGTFLRYIFK